MKFIKGDIIIDAQYEFTHNIFLRDGFVPLTEEITKEEEPEELTLEELREKAKALGIRLKKIAEL